MPPRPDNVDRRRTREFAGGLKARDLPGLWRRDWQRAYATLAHDHPEVDEPSGRVRYFFRKWKTFLTELAYKLSPPRRLLLAICLLLVVLGLQTQDIGDASGHGIAAAMLMAISRTTFRLAVETDPSPPAVARMMNRALVDTGGSRAFLTLFYGLLDLASGRLDFVCAGHPYSLLRRLRGHRRRGWRRPTA